MRFPRTLCRRTRAPSGTAYPRRARNRALWAADRSPFAFIYSHRITPEGGGIGRACRIHCPRPATAIRQRDRARGSQRTPNSPGVAPLLPTERVPPGLCSPPGRTEPLGGLGGCRRCRAGPRGRPPRSDNVIRGLMSSIGCRRCRAWSEINSGWARLIRRASWSDRTLTPMVPRQPLISRAM